MRTVGILRRTLYYLSRLRTLHFYKETKHETLQGAEKTFTKISVGKFENVSHHCACALYKFIIYIYITLHLTLA